MSALGRNAMVSRSGQTEAVLPSTREEGKGGKIGRLAAVFSQLLGKAAQDEHAKNRATVPTVTPPGAAGAQESVASVHRSQDESGGDVPKTRLPSAAAPAALLSSSGKERSGDRTFKQDGAVATADVSDKARPVAVAHAARSVDPASLPGRQATSDRVLTRAKNDSTEPMELKAHEGYRRSTGEDAATVEGVAVGARATAPTATTATTTVTTAATAATATAADTVATLSTKAGAIALAVEGLEEREGRGAESQSTTERVPASHGQDRPATQDEASAAPRGAVPVKSTTTAQVAASDSLADLAKATPTRSWVAAARYAQTADEAQPPQAPGPMARQQKLIPGDSRPRGEEGSPSSARAPERGPGQAAEPQSSPARAAQDVAIRSATPQTRAADPRTATTELPKAGPSSGSKTIEAPASTAAFPSHGTAVTTPQASGHPGQAATETNERSPMPWVASPQPTAQDQPTVQRPQGSDADSIPLRQESVERGSTPLYKGSRPQGRAPVATIDQGRDRSSVTTQPTAPANDSGPSPATQPDARPSTEDKASNVNARAAKADALSAEPSASDGNALGHVPYRDPVGPRSASSKDSQDRGPESSEQPRLNRRGSAALAILPHAAADIRMPASGLATLATPGSPTPAPKLPPSKPERASERTGEGASSVAQTPKPQTSHPSFETSAAPSVSLAPGALRASSATARPAPQAQPRQTTSSTPPAFTPPADRTATAGFHAPPSSPTLVTQPTHAHQTAPSPSSTAPATQHAPTRQAAASPSSTAPATQHAPTRQAAPSPSSTAPATQHAPARQAAPSPSSTAPATQPTHARQAAPSQSPAAPATQPTHARQAAPSTSPTAPATQPTHARQAAPSPSSDAPLPSRQPAIPQRAAAPSTPATAPQQTTTPQRHAASWSESPAPHRPASPQAVPSSTSTIHTASPTRETLSPAPRGETSQVATPHSPQAANPSKTTSKPNLEAVTAQAQGNLPAAPQEHSAGSIVAPSTDAVPPKHTPSPEMTTAPETSDKQRTRSQAKPSAPATGPAARDIPDGTKLETGAQSPAKGHRDTVSGPTPPATAHARPTSTASTPAGTPPAQQPAEAPQTSPVGSGKQPAGPQDLETPTVRVRAKRPASNGNDDLPLTSAPLSSSKDPELSAKPQQEAQASASTKTAPVSQTPAHTRPEPANGSGRSSTSDPFPAQAAPPATPTTQEQTTQVAPVVPSATPPLPLINTTSVAPAPSAVLPAVESLQSRPVAGEAASIYQHAAEDAGLAVTVLPHVAHLSLSSDDGNLSLHVRVRDGNADVNVGGSMAPIFESKAPEMRTVLAHQGLGLGSFAADQHGQGQHSQQRPEAAPSEVHHSHPAQSTRTRATAGESPATDEGRIHITA